MREFDQIQFYEVDQAGFDRCYEDFKTGRFHFQVEETSFDPAAYKVFLDSIADETRAFIVKRNAANLASGEEETRLLKRWHAEQAEQDQGALSVDDSMGMAEEGREGDHVHVVAPMTSSVWKVLIEPGERIKQGQTLAILEAMKMEIRESLPVRGEKGLLLNRRRDVAAIRADETMDGLTVFKLVAKPGSLMDPGQTLFILAPDVVDV